MRPTHAKIIQLLFQALYHEEYAKVVFNAYEQAVLSDLCGPRPYPRMKLTINNKVDLDLSGERATFHFSREDGKGPVRLSVTYLSDESEHTPYFRYDRGGPELATDARLIEQFIMDLAEIYEKVFKIRIIDTRPTF